MSGIIIQRNSISIIGIIYDKNWQKNCKQIFSRNGFTPQFGTQVCCNIASLIPCCFNARASHIACNISTFYSFIRLKTLNFTVKGKRKKENSLMKGKQLNNYKLLSLSWKSFGVLTPAQPIKCSITRYRGE